MNFILDFDLKNKIVLLREDLNSEVIKGKVLMSERIRQSAKTIISLKKKGAKIVVISHQGRLGKENFTSLLQHSIWMNKITKIKFIEDIIGEKAEQAIKNLKSGEAILLENVRYLKEETSGVSFKKNKFIKKLSGLCDLYVNDAFSVSHRDNASITGFPKIMKSFAGPLLKREIESLKKIKLKKCLYVLGGAKPEDDMKLLGKNKVLTGGLFAQIIILSKGKRLGAQEKYLKKNLSNYGKIIKKLKEKIYSKEKFIQIPEDFAVEINGRRKEIPLEDFPVKYEIFDIGKKTQERYIKEIKNAESIYMKGPFGDSLNRKFSKGTVRILKTIANSKGFSLIGGGHLIDTLEKYKIPRKKFNHISLSGGALLSYIAGETLPGLEALKIKNNFKLAKDF